jgi:hypothetical protein
MSASNNDLASLSDALAGLSDPFMAVAVSSGSGGGGVEVDVPINFLTVDTRMTDVDETSSQGMLREGGSPGFSYDFVDVKVEDRNESCLRYRRLLLQSTRSIVCQ